MSIVITETLLHRMVKDIKNIQRHPLHSHGIYYQHDENDLLTGYALIIGTSNTPYFGGYYFFKFHFTPNYPYEPPRVEFCTNNESVRFHPNLYKNGNVCISLLNTWPGEQWTSCQNISSILLTICSLLDENPILHEPCITKTHVDYSRYNSAIEYYNLSVAVCDVLNKESFFYKKDQTQFFLLFYNTIMEHYLMNVDTYLLFVDQQIAKGNPDEFLIQSYQMKVLIDYGSLKLKLEHLKQTLIA